MGEGTASSRLRRAAVPGVPTVLSLALSLSTVGSHVFWQDSGFYLTAVKEMSVLYPHGFVAYLVLCRLWTLIFSFLDFTLAVHLFSSVCAAAAAGTVALATRELLRARSPLFGSVPGDPGPQTDVCASAIGCLAATGYTFWFSGIYAKGYSLYFLVLALLLWRLIRAAETRNPRDFTIVAVLIGLAWQAHPSAALTGLALILWVGVHRAVVGWKGVAWRAGLAAGVAAGPALAIPVITSPSLASFGNPDSASEILDYLLGSRFTGRAGVFGWDGSRAASVGQFLWEEMLGVGLVVVTVGLVGMAMRNRTLFLGILAWIVPVLVVTVLFKIEGQHDLWFVSAWLPLYLAGGVGLYEISRRTGRWARWTAAGVAAAGVAWGAAANFSDLHLGNYDLPERFGRMYLEALDPDALLLVKSDDAVAIPLYLTLVRGVRADVTVVRVPRLGEERSSREG